MKALGSGKQCRKGLSTRLALGGLEEGELLRGRCLGVWSVAGTQGDKKEQGCCVLARTHARSWLLARLCRSTLGERRARLGHAAPCLVTVTW